ncbi:glutathione synthase [Sinobacterium caligoides]|nr:glutathione synthase [Sinobacterium caligoides]
MTIRLAIVMDDITAINVKKDSTLAMFAAAQQKGWELFYIQQPDLYLEQGLAKAIAQPITNISYNADDYCQLGEPSKITLSELDVVLMRKDPPFDNEYIYSTYILEAAEREGTLIVNRPSSLRDCNEKIFATQFPQCCPPVLVSRNNDLLKAFYLEHRDVIFKPLDGMGGTAIFRVKAGDPNLSVILETLTQYGSQSIMAQRFIPEITQGDKRILMVDGKPVDYALARVPAEGETRGNLAAGGSGVPQPLTERDRWICQQVAPTLREKGLLFVGLDVIGDYLTEINVTSPTCIRELDDAYNLDIAGQLMQSIEQQLKNN